MPARPPHLSQLVPVLPIGGWTWLVCIFIACQPGVASAQQQIDLHRARVNQMTPPEKESLRIKRRQFQQLTPQQKDGLRQLHEKLEAQPELRQTMKAYSEWLSTLSPSEVAELKRLKPAERVALIKKLRRARQSDLPENLSPHQLSPEDSRIVVQWAEKFFGQHRQEILAKLPAPLRERIVRERNSAIGLQMLLHAAHSHHAAPTVTHDDIGKLLGSLSPRARRHLESFERPEVQREIIKTWVQNSIRKHMHSNMPRRRFEKFQRNNRRPRRSRAND